MYEPRSRTIYTNGIPTTAAGVGRLLDAILQLDRGVLEPAAPPAPARRRVKRALTVVQGGKASKAGENRVPQTTFVVVVPGLGLWTPG